MKKKKFLMKLRNLKINKEVSYKILRIEKIK